jgi:CO/xanthine dehydrogenase Mo-binding subunit
MLIGAAAAEWAVPAAECRAEGGFVVHAAAGKRASYGELTMKAAERPIPSAPALKSPRDFKVIGKHKTRVDARAKVDGTARFGIDVVVPGMVSAYVIHGPVFGAAPASFRAEEAKRRPGVLDVLAFPWGIAVVAEKYYQARAAAKDVTVTWKQAPASGFDTEEMRVAMRSSTDEGNATKDEGNAERAIAGAAVKVEAIYEGPYLAHAALEPQNCVVSAPKDGKVEVWAPNQSPTIVQQAIADTLGGSPDDVVVHSTLAGGAFGRRTYADAIVQCAMIAARVKRPVKVVWSRESDMSGGYYRPQWTSKMRGAVTADGKIAGIANQSLSQSLIAGSSTGPLARAALNTLPGPLRATITNALMGAFASNTISDVLATEGIHTSVYMLENFKVGYTPVHAPIPVGFWRSVGASLNGFVMESFIDELAAAAKADPYEFRKKHLPPGSRARRVLDAVAALAMWGSPKPPGTGRGIARHESFETEVAEVAEVELVNGRIAVRRVWAAVDCGVAVNPDIVRAQVEGAIVYGLSAALYQAITFKDGMVQQSNYDTYPVVRMHEAPEMVVQVLESDAGPTGIGEPGLPPIAAAVANAVFDLTGQRLRRLPLEPAREGARR